MAVGALALGATGRGKSKAVAVELEALGFLACAGGGCEHFVVPVMVAVILDVRCCLHRYN